FKKFRLRRFVERLIDMDEVEIREDPVPLTALSAIIENTPKAVLFKQAGLERFEMIAKACASRKRLIAAFDSKPETVYEDFLNRFANPKKSVEVPSDEAPVHAIKITGKDVDLTKLPFHPQHEYDGSCYISSGIDYVIDPATGRSNVGSRRLSLRNRYQTGTNITAPSDLKRIYEACAKRKERLPITFTIGSHPLDFFAATTRMQGDEYHMCSTVRGESAPFVKSLTNDILVPADAEIILEGYLDERGYCEPEGPFGEYMGYYGAIHMDPVFTCTAITMRKDVMYQTLQHGTAFKLHETDAASMTALRLEATAMRILKNVCREPVAVYSRSTSGGSGTLRVSIRQHVPGEARNAMLALFGGIRQLKHIYVFDEDVNIHDDLQVEWAMGTRFQADKDIVMVTGMTGMPMDPSLEGRRTGAKAGFDCTRPFGRGHEIIHMRCAAKVFDGPARFQTVEQALEAGPLFYAHLVEAVGSTDGRDVATALDLLREKGRLGRDRDGRYHLTQATPGMTGIVGELYHDPNHGT
ncbi:MAG: UbiD family decarboxylase, partial [Alphaproteobacteria bacterium]|nr:UbiD family decarboxylase [Alphaproteobacteria bacterium]